MNDVMWMLRLIVDLLAEVVNINAEITAGSTDDTDVGIDADAPIGIPFLWRCQRYGKPSNRGIGQCQYVSLVRS